MFNIVILEYFICEIRIKNKPCSFFVYVYFFQPDFYEPETCDEPGSWEEKLAEEFRNEQEDFSGRYKYGKDKKR